MNQTSSSPSQGRLPGILQAGDTGTPIAELTPAALRVLESRYLLRDREGKVVETPHQLFQRVSRAIAEAERKWAKGNADSIVQETSRRFFDLLSGLRFLPNSPTLMNAGRPKGQLSACFVLPIEDSLEQVFTVLRDSVVIHKTGGGTGFNFSALRPVGDSISASGGRASGPISFLRIFDNVTNTVKQGGVRRGANMAILDCDHPDIEAFIDSKRRGGIENFNISVAVTDRFMEAVRKRESWALKNPRNGKVAGKVPAAKLWKKICESAWACGDPGLIFIDRINEVNPTPALGKMLSTNPCGELPLLPFESCNLGSISLPAYLQDDDLNWTELERDIHLCVRFLDNVIESNFYSLNEIENITKSNRKIGLGLMGWADVLITWGVPYDSKAATERARTIMQRFEKIAVEASESLARERGAFKGFEKSYWAMRGAKPRRNATVTTIAPTGTISIIAGVSSGIEPVFSLAYERIALEGQRLAFVHPMLMSVLRENGIRSKRVLKQVLETGSVTSVKELPKEVRSVFKTASEIDPSAHVRMQAAFQRHTENAVSKTINLPSSSTVAQIHKVYWLAFDSGCKGITVFRDQSKRAQVLSHGVRGSATASAKRRELSSAVDWLLDDISQDQKTAKKKASVDLANLSRENLKKTSSSR